ncbi:MAG: hypothetical protein QQN65_06340 [Nitrosopumilus sp.]
MKIKEHKEFLLRKKIAIENLQTEKEDLSKNKSELDKQVDVLEQARSVMSHVGVLAQHEIKQVIEELVTQALQAVFGEDYSFEVDDQIQRNKPETNFYVVVRGHRRSLKSELGGGIVDLIAFCLRVVLWAINTPRTSNTIILDEPLKFVDKTRLEYVGVMIKKLSEMLGIQFIIVSHEDQLIEAADRAYLVEQVDGISKVTKVV